MKQISIYQVDEVPLGSGGMGRVMRGVSPEGRQVAIKEILPEFASDFEIRMRTEREVELLQQLNNDSIVKVYDQFPLDNNFYIVMEYVDGLNVEQYVQKYGSIPYERATRFMVKILEAMQAVHEKKIVHRDVKPSNIMIRNDERVCILDFGIAKDLGNQNGGGTVIGTIIGSDGYMSPEQADGFSIDHRADIYALGCVFYFMLTGHHAYDTLSNDFETRNNIANTPFPKLSKYSKKAFPARLQEILDYATDRNMMRRYQSCREFREALVALIPSASPSHTVINRKQSGDIFITVGRENCDIIITDELMKVSRKHLEIAYRNFTGGHFYIITDQSSNGTMVNGRHLGRGESVNIPANGPEPQVYLACDGRYPLDWNEVKMQIAEKLKATDVAEPQNGASKSDNSQLNDSYNDWASDTEDTPRKVTFFGAIRLLFTRAFDFKGRSRRSEYWYVYLFNMLLSPFLFVVNLMALDGAVAMITMGLAGLYFILAMIPCLALTVRRLHDIGKPWTAMLWWLLGCIPFVGFVAAPVVLVIWIIWMATDSDDDNRWGPNPKG